MGFIQKVNEIYTQLEVLLGLDASSIEINVSNVSDMTQDVTLKHDSVVLLAQDVDTKSSEIKNLSVEVLSLATGESPSIDYNASLGKLTIGIPRGDEGQKGDRGEAFKVDVFGLTSDRATYDNLPRYASFLAVDTSTLYFKVSDASADWSSGVSFGKGDDGTDGLDLTIDAIIDNNDGTYTWQFSDGTDFITSDLTGATGAVGLSPAHELVAPYGIRFKNPDGSWGSTITLDAIGVFSNQNTALDIRVYADENKAMINPIVFNSLTIESNGVFKLI